MKATLILGVILLFIPTAEARSIEGYGEVGFGDSLQEVRGIYPELKQELSGRMWACDLEAPFIPHAEALFLFSEQNTLNFISISGFLTKAHELPDALLANALVEKYGTADSVKEVWTRMFGTCTHAIWTDAQGNRLWLSLYHASQKVYLEYVSAAMAQPRK